MSGLALCAANFSEGRRGEVIDSIANQIAAAGAAVLGAESDADHNRAVVTFAGAPDVVSEAAFAGIKRAAQLIDMERHRGQHPRIGAADVIPFVPLRGLCMDHCVRLAHGLGERVGAELGLPVFLYGHASTRDGNRKLADIRRGGYEGLKASLPANLPPLPDFGPRTMGRAGGCCIGARDALIAFNVYLNAADVKIARQVARTIRASSGGLPGVQALGMLVKGRAQVSMNLTDYKSTSISDAVAAIRRESSKLGLEMASSEIIGLLPRDALDESDVARLKIENYSPARVLEYQLERLGLGCNPCAAVSNPTPGPSPKLQEGESMAKDGLRPLARARNCDMAGEGV